MIATALKKATLDRKTKSLYGVVSTIALILSVMPVFQISLPHVNPVKLSFLVSLICTEVSASFKNNKMQTTLLF